MPLYTVRKRVPEGVQAPKPRLVKADRKDQVANFIIKDFDIERADAEEAATLGADGVKVETAE